MTTRGKKITFMKISLLLSYRQKKKNNNLKLLFSKQTWFGDGLFDFAPVGKQLYTIHPIVSGNKTLPQLYCIASNKDEKTYDEI